MAEDGEESGEEVQVMVIECPPDVGPGDTLTVETEDGTEVDIEVPPGISPGQEFEVDLDARLAELKAKAEADAKAKAGAEAEASAAAARAAQDAAATPASPEESPQPPPSAEHAGVVWLQTAAGADFEPVWMCLAGATTLSFKRKQEDAGVVRAASVESCAVLAARTPRAGRPHAFRLDLASADSLGDSRYLLSVEHFSDLQGWLTALATSCVDGVDATLKLLQERGLDSVAPSGRAAAPVKDRPFSLRVAQNVLVKQDTSLSLSAVVLPELERRVQQQLGLADRIRLEILDEDFEQHVAVACLDDVPKSCQVTCHLGDKPAEQTKTGRKVDVDGQKRRVQEEVMALKEKQLAAMEAEQYEECALLRDVMKLLEEGLQAADAPVASKSRPSDESAPPRDPPEALEGELNTFERLAKPLLPDGATPKKRRGRTSQRRGSPGRTRAVSPAASPGEDLPERSPRTSQTRPLTRVQQESFQRLTDAVDMLQKSLRSLSYDHGGQNAQKLFRLFDIRRMDKLTVKEFTASVRKGGKIKVQQMNVGEVNELFRVIDTNDDGVVVCDEFASFVWRASASALAADIVHGVDSTGRRRKKSGVSRSFTIRQGFDNGSNAHAERMMRDPAPPKPHILSTDGTRPLMDPLDWTVGPVSTKYMSTQPKLYGSIKRDYSEKTTDRHRSRRVQALVSPPRGAHRSQQSPAGPAEYHGYTRGTFSHGQHRKRAEWRATKRGDTELVANAEGREYRASSRKKRSKAKDQAWIERVDKYQAQKQVREKARAVAKVKLDAQRAAIDPVHNPRFLHRKPKSEAEMERMSERLAKRDPSIESKMNSTRAQIEEKVEESIVQYSWVKGTKKLAKTISASEAREVGDRLMRQGTLEPKSPFTDPRKFEEIRIAKGLNEHSYRLTSPERSMRLGSPSRSSMSTAELLGGAKAAGASPGRSRRSPARSPGRSRSPQLQAFLARQEEAIEMQRKNLLAKKRALIEQERTSMQHTAGGRVTPVLAKGTRRPGSVSRRSPARSPASTSRRSPARGSSSTPRRSRRTTSTPQRTGSRARSSERKGKGKPVVSVAGEVVLRPAGEGAVGPGGEAVPVARARIRKAAPTKLEMASSQKKEAAALTAAVAAVVEPDKADVGSWPKEDSPEETDASDLVGAAQKEKAQQRSPKGKRKPPKPKGPKPTKSDPARGPGLMLPGRAERNELFDRCDVHSNGALSLTEVEQSVAELWPRFDAKPTLMRAYKAADKDGTGLIKRPQFRLLLMYIVYINSHWETLEAIVVGKDGQLDLAEFKRGIGLLGIDLGEEDMAAAFGDMDADSSGGILFDDFCTWCAALSVTAEVEEVEAKVTEAVEADEAAAVAQQPAGERLAAVAAVVEAEVEADDGPARQQVTVKAKTVKVKKRASYDTADV